MSKTKQPGLKELKQQLASAPAEVLSADATNEQVKQRIREKASAALNKAEKLNREEWQIVGPMGQVGAKEQALRGREAISRGRKAYYRSLRCDFCWPVLQ